MGDPLDMLKKAIRIKELKAYMTGEKGYHYENPWAEMPTYLSPIFVHGFNQYVKEEEGNKERLGSEIQVALTQMLEDPVGTWWALSIMYSYFFGYKSGSLLFTIDISPLIPRFTESLKRFKNNLMGNKAWVGSRFQNGLWDDVVFVVNALNRRIKDQDLKILID